jgi:hypothetical protein
MTGMAKRSTTILALAALALAATAAGGTAAGPVHGQIHGVVPHTTQPVLAAPKLASAIGSAGTANTDLTVNATYQNVINQYFTDVAAASVANATDNVYSAGTQYYDGPSNNKVFIRYQSTFGGSYVAHDPLPTNGCDDGADTYCLTDQQLQTEIQKAMTANGWHGGLDHMFFLMTPEGVGSCFDAFSGECSTNVFCAYHSFFVNPSSEDVIYANEPDMGPPGGCTDSTQGYPNDHDADVTVNTISHEHNEAITDPLTDNSTLAWVANDGSEDGDLCAYGFGPQTNPGLNAYNQVINGDHYDLQQEWSNSDGGCVQKLGGAHTGATFGAGPLFYQGGPVMHANTTYAIYWLPTAGNTSAPVVSGTAAVNHTLTTTHGVWNGAPSSFSVQWQRCSSSGTSCADISGATATTYMVTTADGGHTLRSTVRATNVNGQSQPASSAATAVVPAQPASTGAPVVSGTAAVGKTLSTSNGTWNNPVNYTYAWLRCSASGTGCATISGAAAPNYVLTQADAGHTLESRVTGSNIVGNAAATSSHTAVVVDVPAPAKAPHISGRAKVGKKLSGSTGSWTYSPTAYRYQWLRCNAHGGGCKKIGHATHAKYKVTKRDAAHKLRLRVTAVNAAGSKAAVSGATSRVKH